MVVEEARKKFMVITRKIWQNLSCAGALKSLSVAIIILL